MSAASTEHRIEDHALIGDTRTAALVSPSGSIDWMCLPRFDSPPVFARLIGGESAGRFTISPAKTATISERRYLDSTATVLTLWSIRDEDGDHGALMLSDSMIAEVRGTLLPATTLVRRIEAVGEPVLVRMVIEPRFGYERARPSRIRRRPGSITIEHARTAMAVSADDHVPLDVDRDLTFRVHPGEPVTIVMTSSRLGPLVLVPPTVGRSLAERDEQRWRTWVSGLRVHPDQAETIVRSLITLQLLTYAPSGAPVAAPTSSLPEELGGARNWDYRYAWPRDASIGIEAFLGYGKHQEAAAFLAWLRHAARLALPRLPTLFNIDGRKSPAERELQDWPGYANSVPVRVGNEAADQRQLDGYGWVLGAARRHVEAGHHLDNTTWRMLRSFADKMVDSWPLPDAGIWERRDEPRHHVHSKLMVWHAFESACRIAEMRGGRAVRRVSSWRRAQQELGEEIRTLGWNEDIGSYTDAYGSDDVDAAVLLLARVGVEEPTSSRVRSTVDTIRERLSPDGVLVYRYRQDDGLTGDEGAFLPCSFWLVQALALTGRVAEAQETFARLMELVGPLGLLAEEIDPVTGRHLGNFPQAFSHATLLQTSIILRESRSPEVTVEPDRAADPPASGSC